MDIYDPETGTTQKQPKQPKNQTGIFQRSLVNDWTPLWEKWLFFAIGLIGLEIIATIVEAILLAAFPQTYVTATIDGSEVTSINTLGSVAINFTSYTVLVIIFLLFLFLDGRKTGQKIFFDFSSGWTYLWGVCGFFALLVFQELMSLIYNFTIPNYGQNANQSSIIEMFSGYPFFIFVMTVFFAPFVEELTYRVGLVDTIGHKYKYRWFGIIFSAIIFGFIHFDWMLYLTRANYLMSEEVEQSVLDTINQEILMEWVNLPIYIGSGIILALTYTLTGKLACSMTAHMLLNLLSSISILITSSIASGDSSSATSAIALLFPLLSA